MQLLMGHWPKTKQRSWTQTAMPVWLAALSVEPQRTAAAPSASAALTAARPSASAAGGQPRQMDVPLPTPTLALVVQPFAVVVAIAAFVPVPLPPSYRACLWQPEPEPKRELPQQQPLLPAEAQRPSVVQQ